MAAGSWFPEFPLLSWGVRSTVEKMAGKGAPEER